MKKTITKLFLAILSQSYAISNLPTLEINKTIAFSSPADYIYRAPQHPNESSVRFLDLEGNVLMLSTIQEKYNISSLPAGVCIIQSLDEEGNVLSSQKFMKN